MPEIINLGWDGEKAIKKYWKNARVEKNPTKQTSLKLFEKRQTYKQNWPIYYQSSRSEKLVVYKLINMAVDYLNIKTPYKGDGRPRVNYPDIIKALCIKTYTQLSSWRLESELKLAKAMGILDYVYKRSALNKYMNNSEITNHLHLLYKLIAEPLSMVEVYFAVDTSGISTFNLGRWIKSREEYKQHRNWTKLHIATGVKTNVITSAEITKGNVHDSKMFKPLLDDTCKIFMPKEISADAGYLSKKLVKYIGKKGIEPYIMIRKNVRIPKRRTSSPWNSMLNLWKNSRMQFADHYHKRSNVESTFAMIKRKFGFFVRAKKEKGQENEILTKIVCHNSCVLAEAILEFDLDVKFMAS